MIHSIDHRVCVAVGRPDMRSAVNAAREISTLADVVEIRLDCIADAEVKPFLDTVSGPLLFTNRPTWEGGTFAGPEQERIDLLLDAVRGGAAYIDLELQAPSESLQRLRDALAGSKTLLILSHHNFELTPSREELVKRLSLMQEKGAHVGKIVTMAHDYHDVLRVLQLQEEAMARNFPLIAFCMGRAGIISRLATLELGGYMTYCAVDAEEATAPGQIAVADFKTIYRILEDRPARPAGLLEI
ncbi:MAG: type I 3-dehydroquinate dehydratase [Desulfoprunum sp.]|nr:type I 3-dehydroquinate dehydratase [Desulfoprunum sp.]